MGDWTVIVPVYNAPQHLKVLMQCLANSQAEDVIFIDDASDDETTQQILEIAEQRWKVIRLPENMGFAHAVNVGIENCQGDVILINTDVSWQDPWTLHRLAQYAYRDDRVGIVSPYAQTPYGVQGWAVADSLYSPYRQVKTWAVDAGQCIYREVDEVPFVCVYIKRQLLQELGFLNPQLKHYLSDSAFCLKAREAGWKILMVPLFIRHAVSSSMPNQAERWLRYHHDIAAWKQLFSPIPKPTLTLYGTLAQSGYGYLLYNAWKTLKEDFDVALRSLIPATAVEFVDAEGALFRPPSQPILSIQIPTMALPPYIYTMFETNHVPSSWIPILRQFKMVFVPCGFNVETFSSCVPVPVMKLPPPLNFEGFHEIVPYRFRFGPFVIFSVFEWGERKWPEWIRYAQLALVGRKDVAIYLVTYSNSVDVKQAIRQMHVPGGPPVVVMSHVPREVLISMFKGASLFVLPSRGEGFCFPVAEAMFAGTPVVTCKHTGLAEYVHKGNAILVDWSWVPCRTSSRWYMEPGAMWAQPDPDDFVDKLRWCYENYSQLSSLTLQAKVDVERFSIERVRPKWVEVIESLTS